MGIGNLRFNLNLSGKVNGLNTYEYDISLQSDKKNFKKKCLRY